MTGVVGRYGKWILQGPALQERNPPTPDESVKMRLFCVPQAGCGAWVYHGWTHKLPPDIEVMPLELPGRNSRMMEPKQHSMKDLVNDVVEAILPLLREKPYALLGHSMGAWLVYEVAKALQARGEPPPLKLYVVANRPPHLYGATNDPDQIAPTLGNLPAAEFWTHLERRYGKNPDLQHEGIRKFIFPVLQADFALLETYQPSDPSFTPLSCPVAACGAEGDNRYSKSQLAEWSKHTSSNFEEHWFEGNPAPDYWGTSHRFIIDHPGPFQAFLSEDLPKLL
mmetsp:Transcript_46070/g.87902  ORF Transcript_46070/g.87902 Transcript_46070/m.87902 type:complete len:281 (-) Transcript_46070:529-1371(-)